MATAKKTPTRAARADGFSEDERAAMRERAKELRAQAKDPAAGAAAVVAAIAEMPDSDRVLAEGVHRIVTEVAPELTPRTWYGMPAYANAGKIVVFFKPAVKFKSRYCTVGFEDAAALDDGSLWPTSYALTALTPAVEKQLRELVRRAAG